jgi:4-amino-4-deoxy-L-arabinose transferase-like glycosyltransferase
VSLRPGVWWGALSGALLVVAAAVFMRALGTQTNYDESVYLASLDAMRRGQELGTEIYTSQPPVFYWVLRALASPFGNSIEGIRAMFALLAVTGIAAAVTIGWRLHGPPAGIAAGALLAVAPPFPSNAHVVAADAPAIAIGLVSLAVLTLALRDTHTRALAALAGAVLAAAMLTKVLAVPFVVPFCALAVAERQARRALPAAVAGMAGLALVLVVAHGGAIDDMWRGVFSDHRGNPQPLDVKLDPILRFLHPRTPIAYLTAAGLAAVVLVPRARSTWPLWTLLPASVLFLLAVPALLDHHLVLLSAAVAIAAGPSLALGVAAIRPRALRLTGTALLVLLVGAGLYQEQRRLHRNDLPERPEVLWAAEALDAVTGPGDVVVTDRQVIGFLASREQPGQLVDVSNTRISGGGISEARLAAEIERSHAAAVVADREFRDLPGVLARLAELYPERVRCGEATLYLRARLSTPPCPIS